MAQAATWQADLAARVESRLARRARGAWPSNEYRDEPVRFGRDVLAFNAWDKQAAWIQALAPEDAAVSVASGHKTGKSGGAAVSGLWFWGTRRRARVVLMAPKIEHIEVVLWPEIRRLYLNSGRCPTCREKERQEDKPVSPCTLCTPLGDPSWIGTDPTKGLRAPDGREIFAYTSRKADAIGGLSGPEMLFIFDESSGIDDAVFEAMKGNEAGGVRKLLLGNPLRTVGEFYESRHNNRRFYSYVARISSEDTPNARSGEKLIPALATREWCEKRAEEWGKDSVTYAVRVQGKDPKYEEGQLVPLDVLEAAEQRWEKAVGEGRLQVGVDVAFTGDQAGIAARRGMKILDLVALDSVGDEDTLAAHVMGVVRAQRHDHERKPLVVYDINGPGARLTKALRDYADEIDFIGINGTNAARRPKEYLQLRDEVACNFAAWLKAGGAIPTDGKLEGEIGQTKAVDFGHGRKKVISNDALKKILKRSPDRRNACELAVWDVRRASAEEEQEKAPAPQPEPRAGSLRGDGGRTAPGAGINPYAGSISPYGGGVDPYGGRGGRRWG
jgi:phage terminase large subunit